jgi:hypothetical protein
VLTAKDKKLPLDSLRFAGNVEVKVFHKTEMYSSLDLTKVKFSTKVMLIINNNNQ